MCYSAQIRQIEREYFRLGIKLDYSEAERIFLQRKADPRVKVPRAFEAYFNEPRNEDEKRINALIADYRATTSTTLQQDIFRQAKRLADAERSLQSKETRKAREDVRIATAKIEANRARLARLNAPDIDVEDGRIFPFWHVPVIVRREGVNVLTLARYHLRQPGQQPSVDRKWPGLYNARRDNLSKFWRGQFGHTHALMLVSSFFENVEREGKNVVLHFNPRPAQTMYVACLYAESEGPEGKFLSFAAVTDDPPPEIAAAGHDRCIVNLEPRNVEAWLTPDRRTDAELQAILDDRQRPYYEHAVAA